MTNGDKWEIARAWILEEIARRELSPDDPLPREAEIQKATGIGRHSVRRALASLAAEGRINIQQGRGTFVTARPAIIYRVGSRTRFREALRAQGAKPQGEGISTEILPAPEDVAEKLELRPGAPAHRIVRRGLADGVPISITRTWHSADRFPDLGTRRAADESVTEIYRSHGIADYRRLETVLAARMPQKWEARMLSQPADQPVMEVFKTDVTLEGEPIAWGDSIWAAGRVRFALTMGED